MSAGWIGLSSRAVGVVWGCTRDWHMHGWVAGLEVVRRQLARGQTSNYVSSHELREPFVAAHTDVTGPAGSR